MGRPKGSKNKPKLVEPSKQVKEEYDKWQSQKERQPVVVESVTRRRKRESRPEINSTTIEPSPSEVLSSGTSCVKPATTEGKDSKREREIKVIKGYVNIQKNDLNPKRISFYTGADIHDTEEAAKKIANKNTVATIYVAFEVKI